MSHFEAASTEARLQNPRPLSVRLRRLIGPGLEVVQAFVVMSLLIWLVLRGAAAMDYNWQWYRVQGFLFTTIEGNVVLGPLLRGLVVTLQIAGISIVLTILIGFVTTFLRLSTSIAGRAIATVYLEAIRNTPLLVQLFLFYFVIAPIFGIDRFWAGVLCLSFFEGSFASEIIRGGIQAVDRGQYEAADAVGFNTRDKYRYVVIPQAMPLILPPLTGLLISLIKHSAIVSVIAVSELTTQGLNLIADTFMAFEVWFTVAAIYLVLTISLSVAVSIFETRLKKQK